MVDPERRHGLIGKVETASQPGPRFEEGFRTACATIRTLNAGAMRSPRRPPPGGGAPYSFSLPNSRQDELSDIVHSHLR